MSSVPDSLERWMAPFAALFTRPTWRHALVLVAGSYAGNWVTVWSGGVL